METPEKRSGHIGLKFREYLLVWGGYNSLRFMNPAELWVYNIKIKIWHTKQLTGRNEDMPLCSSGSCAAMIDSRLYLFAGYSRLGRQNSVHELDLGTLKWKKLVVESKEPSTRDKLGCWVSGTRIIFFGGYGMMPTEENIQSGRFIYDNDNLLPTGWNNDLLVFDTVSHTWEALPFSDTTPSPRAAHACSSISDKVGYLFGGRHLGQRLNDLYSLDLCTYVWTKIVSYSAVPEGRTWHSLTPTDDGHLLLFGGLNTQMDTLADSWIYNIKENIWAGLKHEYREPKRWHSACRGLYPGQIIVFGGCCSMERMFLDGVHVNNVRIFHVTPPPLRKIALDAVVKFGPRCGSWAELPRILVSDIAELLSGA